MVCVAVGVLELRVPTLVERPDRDRAGALSFLRRVTAHILPPRAEPVRFHGVCAANARLRPAVTEAGDGAAPNGIVAAHRQSVPRAGSTSAARP
jgi:hypothetical protein